MSPASTVPTFKEDVATLGLPNKKRKFSKIVIPSEASEVQNYSGNLFVKIKQKLIIKFALLEIVLYS